MTVDKKPLSHAFRADKPEDLLRTQARAVGMILKRFATTIVQEALRHKPEQVEGHKNGRDVIRPHNVFTIDGARGSGKTYTLLSLENAIQVLSDRWRSEGNASSDIAGRWQEFLRDHIGPDALDALDNLKETSSHTRLAQVLRIIFPGDMEGRESLMESIFAGMCNFTNYVAGIFTHYLTQGYC
jgi:hypothetical protein